MLRLERVLCPIDFSETARHALEYAGALAAWYGARLSVVHVVPKFVPPTSGLTPVPTDPIPSLILLDPAVREPLERRLDDFVSPLRRAEVDVELELAEGEPTGEILDRAAAVDADMIVIGTEGAGGLKRLLLGSVAARVVERAPCPVMTVGPPAASRTPGEPVVFRRILCGIDFSEPSLRALDYALSLAQEGRARLTLAHVIEGPAARPPDIHFDVGVDRQRWEEETRARLRRLCPQGAGDWAELGESVTTGRPHEALLRLAAETGAELIVLGVHGRKLPLAHFGSTTARVVREAPCPVLTVRAITGTRS